jgi:hypothetical protein
VTAGTAGTLAALLDLPGVAAGVDEAREACAGLRWHPALRRRGEEVRAECNVRAAWASARLDGARREPADIRAAFLGDDRLGEGPDAATTRGAVRAVAQADRMAREWQAGRPPAVPRMLSRLHVAAAAGLLPDDALGRPDPAAAERLRQLAGLLTAPAQAPALLVAALAHAELVTLRPFPAGTGVLARAVARAAAVGRGLDPMAVAVWEHGLAQAGPAATAALAGYASGRPEDVAAWLVCWSRAMVAGAAEGAAVADAVLAGRLPG